MITSSFNFNSNNTISVDDVVNNLTIVPSISQLDDEMKKITLRIDEGYHQYMKKYLDLMCNETKKNLEKQFISIFNFIITSLFDHLNTTKNVYNTKILDNMKKQLHSDFISIGNKCIEDLHSEIDKINDSSDNIKINDDNYFLGYLIHIFKLFHFRNKEIFRTQEEKDKFISELSPEILRNFLEKNGLVANFRAFCGHSWIHGFWKDKAKTIVDSYNMGVDYYRKQIIDGFRKYIDRIESSDVSDSDPKTIEHRNNLLKLEALLDKVIF